MPEIRINSRPCTHCDHRNVTSEIKVCERCGTSLAKARNKRVILGSMLSIAAVAMLTLLIWSPWSADDDVWVKQTSNNSERVQDNRDRQAPSTPQEKITPTQPKQEFEKTKEENDDEPVLFAEEIEVKTEKPAETFNDEVVNNDTPTEAERFSTLTADKEIESADYSKLTEGARMIASDLGVRVASSSKEFNSTHFDRLVKMLNEPEYRGKELFLVGIAGSVDSRFIAKNRADFAKEVLVKNYNIPIAITTHGIDPNSDEPARGQRLEVWIK